MVEQQQRNSIAVREQFQVISDMVTFLMTSAETGGRLVVYTAMTPPGAGVPPHRHHGVWEFGLVVAGEYAFLKEETIISMRAGDSISIAEGETHSYINTGDMPGKLLIIASPGHTIEGFFRAIGVPSLKHEVLSATGPPNIHHLITTARQYGIEILP